MAQMFAFNCIPLAFGSNSTELFMISIELFSFNNRNKTIINNNNNYYSWFVSIYGLGTFLRARALCSARRF